MSTIDTTPQPSFQSQSLPTQDNDLLLQLAQLKTLLAQRDEKLENMEKMIVKQQVELDSTKSSLQLLQQENQQLLTQVYTISPSMTTPSQCNIGNDQHSIITPIQSNTMSKSPSQQQPRQLLQQNPSNRSNNNINNTNNKLHFTFGAENHPLLSPINVITQPTGNNFNHSNSSLNGEPHNLMTLSAYTAAGGIVVQDGHKYDDNNINNHKDNTTFPLSNSTSFVRGRDASFQQHNDNSMNNDGRTSDRGSRVLLLSNHNLNGTFDNQNHSMNLRESNVSTLGELRCSSGQIPPPPPPPPVAQIFNSHPHYQQSPPFITTTTTTHHLNRPTTPTNTTTNNLDSNNDDCVLTAPTPTLLGDNIAGYNFFATQPITMSESSASCSIHSNNHHIIQKQIFPPPPIPNTTPQSPPAATTTTQSTQQPNQQKTTYYIRNNDQLSNSDSQNHTPRNNEVVSPDTPTSNILRNTSQIPIGLNDTTTNTTPMGNNHPHNNNNNNNNPSSRVPQPPVFYTTSTTSVASTHQPTKREQSVRREPRGSVVFPIPHQADVIPPIPAGLHVKIHEGDSELSLVKTTYQSSTGGTSPRNTTNYTLQGSSSMYMSPSLSNVGGQNNNNGNHNNNNNNTGEKSLATQLQRINSTMGPKDFEKMVTPNGLHSSVSALQFQLQPNSHRGGKSTINYALPDAMGKQSIVDGRTGAMVATTSQNDTIRGTARRASIVGGAPFAPPPPPTSPPSTTLQTNIISPQSSSQQQPLSASTTGLTINTNMEYATSTSIHEFNSQMSPTATNNNHGSTTTLSRVHSRRASVTPVQPFGFGSTAQAAAAATTSIYAIYDDGDSPIGKSTPVSHFGNNPSSTTTPRHHNNISIPDSTTTPTNNNTTPSLLHSNPHVPSQSQPTPLIAVHGGTGTSAYQPFTPSALHLNGNIDTLHSPTHTPTHQIRQTAAYSPMQGPTFTIALAPAFHPSRPSSTSSSSLLVMNEFTAATTLFDPLANLTNNPPNHPYLNSNTPSVADSLTKQQSQHHGGNTIPPPIPNMLSRQASTGPPPLPSVTMMRTASTTSLNNTSLATPPPLPPQFINNNSGNIHKNTITNHTTNEISMTTTPSLTPSTSLQRSSSNITSNAISTTFNPEKVDRTKYASIRRASITTAIPTFTQAQFAMAQHQNQQQQGK